MSGYEKLKLKKKDFLKNAQTFKNISDSSKLAINNNITNINNITSNTNNTSAAAAGGSLSHALEENKIK